MPTIPPAPPRRRRILVVEDEPTARSALAQVLSTDYDVTVVGDGIEGTEAAQRIQPDLIVTDVDMPRLNGREMVRRIREKSGWKIPVIFLTALNSPADVIAGIAAGARHYLTKPVDLSDLEQRVARVLGLARAT